MLGSRATPNSRNHLRPPAEGWWKGGASAPPQRCPRNKLMKVIGLARLAGLKPRPSTPEMEFLITLSGSWSFGDHLRLGFGHRQQPRLHARQLVAMEARQLLEDRQ